MESFSRKTPLSAAESEVKAAAAEAEAAAVVEGVAEEDVAALLPTHEENFVFDILVRQKQTHAHTNANTIARLQKDNN